jgi:hypothetical protein
MAYPSRVSSLGEHSAARFRARIIYQPYLRTIDVLPIVKATLLLEQDAGFYCDASVRRLT